LNVVLTELTLGTPTSGIASASGSIIYTVTTTIAVLSATFNIIHARRILKCSVVVLWREQIERLFRSGHRSANILHRKIVWKAAKVGWLRYQGCLVSGTIQHAIIVCINHLEKILCEGLVANLLLLDSAIPKNATCVVKRRLRLKAQVDVGIKWS
jgi:hypothetical protein